MKTNDIKLIARTFAGLEEQLEAELKSLGIKGTKAHKRAVAFDGDQETMYKVNMFSRLALDVLTPIYKFQAASPEQLYEQVKKVKWHKYLNPTGTFHISTIVYSSIFTHNQFAALKCKDAIVDQFRENNGERPDVDKFAPDLRITLRINENKCELLLNSSGAPLFKRGYRKRTGAAPLNEILAASIILNTDWNKKTPLIDPMCGSGTIPIEAGLIARNIAPCLLGRPYGFQKWNNYNEATFKKLMKEAEDAVVENRVIIKGYDLNTEVLHAAKQNLKNIPQLAGNITFDKADFFQTEKSFKDGLIVFNPPYDKRIEVYDAEEFYNKIGTHLKHKFDGYDAWIISGNLMAIKRVGLKAAKKLTLFNGAEECKLLHFPLYRGSKKTSSVS